MQESTQHTQPCNDGNACTEDSCTADGCQFTPLVGDCDDDDATQHPGATELCNEEDDNCIGGIDEGYIEDGDAYFDEVLCPHGQDCDDTNPAIYNGAPETCEDTIDSDCDNSLVDEFPNADGDEWPDCIDDDADGDGDLARVALREATEETGIAGLRISEPPVDLDIHLVDPPKEDPHEHHDVRYLVVSPPEAMVTGNHESLELRWVAPSELSSMGVDEGVVRLADRALARLAAVEVGS